MERRLAFGDVAQLYDRARPSYPSELIDDVLAFSGAAPGDRALEVGAGTGKATVRFAERGLEVLALEPSPGMAAVASRSCAPHGNVTIEQSEFEHWDSAGRRFKLLFSAQAWHWIPRELRYARAREVLRADGTLAVFWNRPDWQSAPLRDELAGAYRRAAPALGAGVGPGPMYPGAETRREWWTDWAQELAAAPEFGSPEPRSYRWLQTYPTESYLELLRTHSDHIVLDDDRLERLLDAIGEVIGRHGGVLELGYVSELWMARVAG